MDNAQKAIMIGVGLFITIIIIAAVMLITGMGQDLMNQGTQQLSQVSTQLQRSLTQEFDDKTMSGAQVLAAVKSHHGDGTLVIQVNTNKKNAVDAGGRTAKTSIPNGANCYVTDSTEFNNNIAPVTWFSNTAKQSEGYYIQTTAQYHSYVIRIGDENGDVVGLRFDKI